ncbi:MAG TPA: hypothetical protein VFH31_17435 [Pyrinomonadaceae bacterium]|nr:hypothetical protein [Pyrinomonadaceae bacterium]
MDYLRISLVALLVLGLTSGFNSVAFFTPSAAAQNQSTALERGYRTGYSDGYNAGYKDVADRAARDHKNKEEYQRADRSYNQAWGPLEDYRDGYQQGFEVGYTAGYDQQPFNSSIPTGLVRRGSSDTPHQSVPSEPANEPINRSTPEPVSASGGPVLIPRDTMLLVELQSSLSTDASQRGDRFQARVIQPGEYQGAIIDGRVARVKRPGRVKGVAELQLSFDQIRLPDNRMGSLSAEVVEVIDTGNRDTGEVDPEGGVKGRDSTKDDVSKVGAATGVGAIIGAIVGGGKGAAIGAAIGGGIATGGVLSRRGSDIRLERGQQLRIRVANETRIQ